MINTYQMYLKDSFSRLTYDNNFLKNIGIKFGIKLVRGAYLKTETERFHRLGLKEHPNFQNINETHQSFKNAVHFSLNNINNSMFFFFFKIKGKKIII
jgi:proline dehydrogenase